MNFKLISLTIIFITTTFAAPIDVTGKNIKYYKLLPNEGSGSYNFDYGTHDGTQRRERGYLKQGTENEKPQLVITGTYNYHDTNGEFYEVSYIADEQGYRIVPKEELALLEDSIEDQSNKIIPVQIDPKKNQPKPTATKVVPVGILPDKIISKPILPLKSGIFSANSTTRQSKVIKLNIIKSAPDVAIDCIGKCAEHESEIFVIKNVKI